MSLKFDPNGVPAEGLHLEGELHASVFELPEQDAIKAVTPLSYNLDVTRDENDIIVLGNVEVTFELECGRCAERFLLRLEEPGFATEVTVENEQSIDLTTCLRDDILLALPTHPRCETGNVTPRKCPAEGRFDPTPENSDAELHKEADKNVWGALDQLNNLKRN